MTLLPRFNVLASQRELSCPLRRPSPGRAASYRIAFTSHDCPTILIRRNHRTPLQYGSSAPAPRPGPLIRPLVNLLEQEKKDLGPSYYLWLPLLLEVRLYRQKEPALPLYLGIESPHYIKKAIIGSRYVCYMILALYYKGPFD